MSTESRKVLLALTAAFFLTSAPFVAAQETPTPETSTAPQMQRRAVQRQWFKDDATELEQLRARFEMLQERHALLRQRLLDLRGEAGQGHRGSAQRQQLGQNQGFRGQNQGPQGRAQGRRGTRNFAPQAGPGRCERWRQNRGR